ncbi:hypothetical protein A9Q99_07810 [Gammaproteobacteria bacterium 45_16_T64]|nr:hypothetical protein A9Q99_07810 [Gammaproteobacteria bacterium 45_16_T64]
MPPVLAVSIEYSRVLANVIGITDSELPALLAGTSISPAKFKVHEGYIDWHDQHRIIKNALSIFNQEGLGVVAGQFYPLASHGAMGSAAMSAPNLKEALAMFMRYSRVRAQFTQLSSTQKDGNFILTHELLVEHDSVGQFLIEALLISAKLSIDFLVGRPINNAKVLVNFPKPSYNELMEDILKCPVYYEQPEIEFILPIEYLSLPVATRNKTNKELAEQQCQTLEQQFEPTTTVSEHVIELLRQLPGRQLTQAQMAQLLNMSSRTLLRRLKEEGVGYQALHDAEQKKLALHYLNQPNITLELISESMGYHDPSSFRRAFKRWFGTPPSEYKRTQ